MAVAIYAANHRLSLVCCPITKILMQPELKMELPARPSSIRVCIVVSDLSSMAQIQLYQTLIGDEDFRCRDT